MCKKAMPREEKKNYTQNIYAAVKRSAFFSSLRIAFFHSSVYVLCVIFFFSSRGIAFLHMRAYVLCVFLISDPKSVRN